MHGCEKIIREKLFELKDEKYKDFHCRLMPTVDRDTVIGIRTPMLRKLAGTIAKTDIADEFINILPHKYYEENNLHGFLIEKIRDYDLCIKKTEEFLPYINNWATCDLIKPKVFKKHTDKLIINIDKWINDTHTYTIRFSIEMLMSFYLDENFSKEYPSMVASVKSDEYYVNMMIAWYFATALAKQYDDVIFYIEQNKLDKWTHNKTIQKAIESYRITPEKKAYLKTLKIK